MSNVELNILKEAIKMQEQLGFKRIKPKRSTGQVTNSANWLSVRIDSKERMSLAFSFDKQFLEQQGWISEKMRVNITSNGKIVIFELNAEGDYALSGEKGTDRVECKITWQEEICKKPQTKERFDIQYTPMNSKGVKRLAMVLPSVLVNE